MKRLFFSLLLLCMTAGAWALPRAEYPRPQFERQDWLNLNGDWTYTFDFVGSGMEKKLFESKGFQDKITVPFCPESKLSGVGYTDFIGNIWYQRSIRMPQEWAGRNVMLNFGAVYYNSEVFIDGRLAGRHFGGSTSFAIDVTRFLADGGEHSLVVECMYTRTTGIWQTVWMEPVAENALLRAQVITDIDQSQIIVHPTFYRESAATLTVTLSDGKKVVATKTVRAQNNSTIVLPVKAQKLWSPENPFLYDLTYEMKDADGKTIDRVGSYVGMRKIHVEGNKTYLNNEPFYQRLVLDQGFYPDGIWTAPTDEALKHDIELSLAAGFNGARLHQKVFEERFHYWADRLGYITWGEAPSWGMNANDPEVARNFLSEWTEEIVRDRNHPSIVTWTPMNEEWWPDRVHYEQDPARLKDVIYNGQRWFQTPNEYPGIPRTNTGFNRPTDNEVYDFPRYEKADKPYLLDEFGGIKWVKGQDQQTGNTGSSWGYGEPPHSLEEFYTRLEGQVDALMEIADNVWGYTYTQLTDVEQEQNGIYFYDRTAKFDMARIKAIFSKKPATSK